MPVTPGDTDRSEQVWECSEVHLPSIPMLPMIDRACSGGKSWDQRELERRRRHLPGRHLVSTIRPRWWLIFAGLTVTGTIRDRANSSRRVRSCDLRESKFMAMAPQGAPVGRHSVAHWAERTVRRPEFHGQKIFFVNFVGERSPVSPAWCITDSQLVDRLFPKRLSVIAPAAAGRRAQPRGRPQNVTRRDS